MKKRWRIAAGILCVALLGTACTKKELNDGEERPITVDKTDQTANKNQQKLEMLEPGAYGDVNGLNLEPGSYISIIGRNSNDSYWNEVKAGAEQAVKDINQMLGYKGDDRVRLNYSGPSQTDNVDEQINILDEELARYPIAVGISMVDATACQVQFDLAAENNIPIVSFDSGSDYQGVVATCSTDNKGAGKAAADRMAGMIGEQGEVAVFVQDSLSTSATDRKNGFVERLAEKYPNIKLVELYHLDKLEERAKEIALEMNQMKAEGAEDVQPEALTQQDIVKHVLKKYPNLKGIYTTNLDTTKLVTGVLDDAQAEQIQLIGFDGGAEQMKLLKSGKVDGLFVQNPFGMGYATVVAAAREVLSLGNEAVINSGYTWVTVDNMKDKEIKERIY